MSHAAPEGEASADMSPRVRRILWWSGLVVCLVAAAVYAALIHVALTDPDTTANLTERIRNRTGRASGRNTSALAIFAAVALVGLMIGTFCLGLADVSRRRSGKSSITAYTSPLRRGGYAYPVRPIGTGWQTLWIVLLAAAFFVIDPLQRATGVLAAGAAPNTALQVLLFLPGLFFSGLAGAVATSLVKKLSYPGQVRRHAERALSPRPGFVRTVLYLWRLDLAVGALAGVFLGAVASLAVSGSTVAAVVFFVLFVIVGGCAATMSLQFWRTGEPLMVTTLSRPVGMRARG